MSYFTRHSDILPDNVKGRRINIIGAGAVGSYTALALAKMGFTNLHIFDFDQVDEENVGVQLYGPEDIGLSKIAALAGLIRKQSGLLIEGYVSKWEGEVLPGLTVMAVDSMLVRKQLWKAHKEKRASSWLIDPRMGAEQASLYVMSPNHTKDIGTYENTLYSDGGAVQEPCTAKATSYTAMLLGGLITKAIKDILTENSYSRIVQWNIADNAMEVQHSGEVGR